MEERVKILEKGTTELKKSVACIEAILPFLATREDLTRVEMSISRIESNLIKWFAGTALAIITAIIASATIVVTMLR